MNFQHKLYVIYSREKESTDYNRQNPYKVIRPWNLKEEQVSIVHQVRSPIAFYQSGIVLDPATLRFEGYWGYEKVADMVPVDYTP